MSEEDTSKARKWQKEKLRKGLCSICGKRKLKHYTQRCDLCQKRQREKRREVLGSKAWKPGGMGRPIKGKEPKWETVDWSEPNTVIAKKLKVSISSVYQKRAKMKREENQ